MKLQTDQAVRGSGLLLGFLGYRWKKRTLEVIQMILGSGGISFSISPISPPSTTIGIRAAETKITCTSKIDLKLLKFLCLGPLLE